MKNSQPVDVPSRSDSASPTSTGLLLSGGIDSTVLLGHLLGEGWAVRPFYVRMGCVWEAAEARAVQGILDAMAHSRLAELVELRMPIDDLYRGHWSTTGRAAPDHRSPDDAVFLPGRNPLLLLKPALWCQAHGIPMLALATLAGNPFADATASFFAPYEAMLLEASGRSLTILRPWERFTKRDVIALGRGLPLELTFSCLAPKDGRHCGRCNKCAERAKAFADLETSDPTCYAESATPSASGQMLTSDTGR